MNPRIFIAQFSRLGLALREKDGEIQVQGPTVPLPETLIEAVRRHRRELAAYLRAEAHWRQVVGEISKLWNALEADGREPTWLDDLELVDGVDAALRGDEPASAHPLIDGWRRAWVEHLSRAPPKRSR